MENNQQTLGHVQTFSDLVIGLLTNHVLAGGADLQWEGKRVCLKEKNECRVMTDKGII